MLILGEAAIVAKIQNEQMLASGDERARGYLDKKARTK
jgi:hypothetical protein